MSGGPGFQRVKDMLPARFGACRWTRAARASGSCRSESRRIFALRSGCTPRGPRPPAPGSRGRVSLTIQFDPAHLFSLEGDEAFVHGNPGDGCLVFWQPGFMIDERTNFGLVWYVELRAARDATRWMNRGRDVITHYLPVSRSEPGAFAAVFSVEFERNVDRVTYVTNIWGYYWDRAALDVPGGPVRPGGAARSPVTDAGPC